mmetsp:Transcript_54477/g.162794  ORF Transcript_54477/g.162794 Transcript_54477/m.162794 type:complete len:96 (+) Transcript_54477:90-377(+)
MSQRTGIPAVIEEEPPHEFYANLVGKVTTVKTKKRAQNAHPSCNPASFSASLNIIPDETPTLDAAEGNSIEAQVSLRELAKPIARMTLISLDHCN